MQDSTYSQTQPQAPSTSLNNKKKIHSRFNSLIQDYTVDSIIPDSINKTPSSSSTSIIDKRHQQTKQSKKELEPSKQLQHSQLEAFPQSPNRSFYHSFSNLNTNTSAWNDSSCSPMSSQLRTIFFENVRTFQSPLPSVISMQRRQVCNSPSITKQQEDQSIAELNQHKSTIARNFTSLSLLHKTFKSPESTLNGQDNINNYKINQSNHRSIIDANAKHFFNKTKNSQSKKELQQCLKKNLKDSSNPIDIARALETKDKWSMICKEYFQAKDHLIQSKKLIPRLKDNNTHKSNDISLSSYNTRSNSFEHQETRFNLSNSPIMCLSTHVSPSGELKNRNPWKKPIIILEPLQNKRNNNNNNSITQSNFNRSIKSSNYPLAIDQADGISLQFSHKPRSNSEGITKSSYYQNEQHKPLNHNNHNNQQYQRRSLSQLINVSTQSQESLVENDEKQYQKEDHIKETNEDESPNKNDFRNNSSSTNIITSIFPANSTSKSSNEALRDKSQSQTLESCSAEERLAACEKIKIFRYFKDDGIPLSLKRKAFKDVQTFYAPNGNQQQQQQQQSSPPYGLSQSICKDVLSFHNSLKNVFLKIDPLFPQQADRRGAKQLILQRKMLSLKQHS